MNLNEKRIQFISENSKSWKETGEELKKMRIKARLSIENVAGHIGVSSTTISKLERGLPVQNANVLERAYRLYLSNIELSEIKSIVNEGEYITARNFSGYVSTLNSYIKREHEKINKIIDTLKLIYGDRFVSFELFEHPSVNNDAETGQVYLSASCEILISFHSEETQKYTEHPLQVCYVFSNSITDISKELQSILEEIKNTIESDREWNHEYYARKTQEAI